MRGNKRDKHRPVPVSDLFNRILPDNFRQKGATIQHYQHFFNSQTSDAVFQMVQVLNVSESALTLSVPSPALVNYLRLHTEQIRQQIREQFGAELQLKIITSPESLSACSEHSNLKPAPHFEQPVCDQLERSAASVDDRELRQALISLSKTLRKKP